MPTTEVQDRLTPGEVLQLLRAGNQRFVSGRREHRDFRGEVKETAAGQAPLAVVLACMDSRLATEIIFDLGLGDVFSIRVAGNIVSEQGLGSMEFGCAVAGAKLLLVLGHTRCGAVMATADFAARGGDAPEYAGLEHLAAITGPIAESLRAETTSVSADDARDDGFLERVAVLNVHHSLREIRSRSATLRRLVDAGELLLAGGLYDVATGRVEFLESDQPLL